MFLGPDEATQFFINTPSAEDIRGADWTYSKMYTKSLMEGIPTSAEMLDILTRRGIIGPEFEQRGSELTDNLNTKILQLETATSVDEKRDLAVEVARAREELFNWNQRLNGPMNNTCEQIADDSRLEYLTSRMVETEEGDKFWDSYDSYLTEKNSAIAAKARFEVLIYLQGLDSDFLESMPEAMAMKELEQEFIDKVEETAKALEATEEENAKIDEIESEEAEEKVVKKKGRKKKKK
jgi:hypothetical protein